MSAPDARSETNIHLACPHCGGHLAFRALPLTRRQVEILRYLDREIRRNGIAPSFDEIAHHFDFSSLATVHEHLSNLERKGVIARSYNAARSIHILVHPDELGQSEFVDGDKRRGVR